MLIVLGVFHPGMGVSYATAVTSSPESHLNTWWFSTSTVLTWP